MHPPRVIPATTVPAIFRKRLRDKLPVSVGDIMLGFSFIKSVLYCSEFLFIPLKRKSRRFNAQHVIDPVFNGGGPGIPIQLFHRVFPAQTLSPEDLDGITGYLLGCLGAIHL